MGQLVANLIVSIILAIVVALWYRQRPSQLLYLLFFCDLAFVVANVIKLVQALTR
jgi:hypothetical protein